MSAFIVRNLNLNGPQLMEQGYMRNDDSLSQIPEPYAYSPPQTTGWGNLLRDTDILWPRTSFPGQNGTANGNQNGVIDGTHQYWEWNWPPTGVHVRKKISGVVVNASSVPQSGVTVSLFNTATGILVDQQISASDGSFTCGDPNNVNCFLVADVAGSPELSGTTIQELTGV